MQNKLQNMRIFVCVASANSFTAAARLLNTTIPQVSRAIAALEAHLHTRLLNRTTRRLALTEAGERYLHRCRSILGYLDEAEAEARDANVNPSGCLRVHCAVSLGSVHIYDWPKRAGQAMQTRDSSRQACHIEWRRGENA